jgi:hypothetical protein
VIPVSSVCDHEPYQEFTIGTRLAIARTRLIQRMSLENSFAVGCSFAVRFTSTFNGGACSDLGIPRDHSAAPPGLYSQHSPLAGSASKTDNIIVSHTIELNATADATGATTAYRFDEFTAYKKHSLIPICSRSVHSSKNAELFRLPNLVRATALPNRPRPQTQIVGGSVAVAEHLLRRFLAITLLPDAIVGHAWRTIREPTSSLS